MAALSLGAAGPEGHAAKEDVHFLRETILVVNELFIIS